MSEAPKTAQQIADGVRQLDAMLWSVRAMGQYLANVGSIEQVEKDATRRKTIALAEAEKAESSMAAAQARLADANKQANAAAEGATREANRIIGAAQAEANDIIAAAKRTAAATEEGAAISVAKAKAEAEALQARSAGLANQIEAQQASLSEINKSVAMLRAQVTKWQQP